MSRLLARHYPQPEKTAEPEKEVAKPTKKAAPKKKE